MSIGDTPSLQGCPGGDLDNASQSTQFMDVELESPTVLTQECIKILLIELQDKWEDTGNQISLSALYRKF